MEKDAVQADVCCLLKVARLAGKGMDEVERVHLVSLSYFVGDGLVMLSSRYGDSKSMVDWW